MAGVLAKKSYDNEKLLKKILENEMCVRKKTHKNDIC